MNRRINPNEIRQGDVLVFKGSGPLFTVLSYVLKIFEPKWDRWGWHVGFVSNWDTEKGWIICESIAQGVVLSALSKYPTNEIRVYRWFETAPIQQMIDRFLTIHLGQKYDILVYPLTALAYILRHYWGRPIPRLFDNSWSCWELAYYFCDRMGEPLAESYDFPMITDMLKQFGEIPTP